MQPEGVRPRPWKSPRWWRRYDARFCAGGCGAGPAGAVAPCARGCRGDLADARAHSGDRVGLERPRAVRSKRSEHARDRRRVLRRAPRGGAHARRHPSRAHPPQRAQAPATSASLLRALPGRPARYNVSWYLVASIHYQETGYRRAARGGTRSHSRGHKARVRQHDFRKVMAIASRLHAAGVRRLGPRARRATARRYGSGARGRLSAAMVIERARAWQLLGVIPLPGSGELATPARGSVGGCGYFGCPRPGHLHNGVDFLAPAGRPVHAADAGRVALVQPRGASGGYGNFICLQHRPHLAPCYAHLGAFAPGLRPGKRVERGQVLGLVGSTDRAAGRTCISSCGAARRAARAARSTRCRCSTARCRRRPCPSCCDTHGPRPRRRPFATPATCRRRSHGRWRRRPPRRPRVRRDRRARRDRPRPSPVPRRRRTPAATPRYRTTRPRRVPRRHNPRRPPAANHPTASPTGYAPATTDGNDARQ